MPGQSEEAVHTYLGVWGCQPVSRVEFPFLFQRLPLLRSPRDRRARSRHRLFLDLFTRYHGFCHVLRQQ